MPRKKRGVPKPAPRRLNADEVALVVSGLRAAVDIRNDIVRNMTPLADDGPLPDRGRWRELIAQYAAEADQARNLAREIEGCGSVTIWKK